MMGLQEARSVAPTPFLAGLEGTVRAWARHATI